MDTLDVVDLVDFPNALEHRKRRLCPLSLVRLLSPLSNVAFPAGSFFLKESPELRRTT